MRMNKEALRDYLKALTQDTPVKEVADKFKTSAPSVFRAARELGIKVNKINNISILTITRCKLDVNSRKQNVDCIGELNTLVDVRIYIDGLRVTDANNNSLHWVSFLNSNLENNLDISRYTQKLLQDNPHWEVRHFKLFTNSSFKPCHFPSFPFEQWEYHVVAGQDVQYKELVAA